MSDGIIKALDDLKDIREPVPEKKVDSVRERTEKVLDLKMRGISNVAIAKALGVDPSTVWRDLKRAREDYRGTLEQEPAANLIAESLMFLEKIAEVCLFEASQSASTEAKIDPATGEVTRSGTDNARGKYNYIRAALSAREMKMKLMLDTGVLPKQPEKLYHSIKRDEEDKASVDTRSEEEIQQQVIELLKRGKNL